MTIEDVAHNVKMNWNTIKNIEKHYLEKHYSKPFLDGVTRIAIDEFAVLKYNGLKKLDRNLITLKFLSHEKNETKIHS
jgi:hypothetical protein